MESKGLKITKNIGLLVNKGFITDESRFKQILINLISNAIKFTPEGIIKIEVEKYQRCNDERQQEEYLRVSVKDTGIGMSSEDLERLFDIYGKLNKNHKLSKQSKS